MRGPCSDDREGRCRPGVHTYSSYARGNEEVIGAFIYLDITPKGRNEKEIMDWVKRHDEYDAPAQSGHVSKSVNA